MEILRIQDVEAEAAAAKAAAALRNGQAIVYPTDTLYGIGVDALNSDAIAFLRELKARDAKKPISVMVGSAADIGTYAELTETARTLAERFLPGALTLVVPAKAVIPVELTLNGAIGIRVPDDAFCRALATAAGRPVTATSANRAGRGVPPTVAGIIEQFGADAGRFALIVDDGPRAAGMPSTVVDCTTNTPRVLREGAIARDALGI